MYILSLFVYNTCWCIKRATAYVVMDITHWSMSSCVKVVCIENTWLECIRWILGYTYLMKNMKLGWVIVYHCYQQYLLQLAIFALHFIISCIETYGAMGWRIWECAGTLLTWVQCCYHYHYYQTDLRLKFSSQEWTSVVITEEQIWKQSVFNPGLWWTTFMASILARRRIQRRK